VELVESTFPNSPGDITTIIHLIIIKMPTITRLLHIECRLQSTRLVKRKIIEMSLSNNMLGIDRSTTSMMIINSRLIMGGLVFLRARGEDGCWLIMDDINISCGCIVNSRMSWGWFQIIIYFRIRLYKYFFWYDWYLGSRLLSIWYLLWVSKLLKEIDQIQTALFAYNLLIKLWLRLAALISFAPPALNW